MAGELVLQPAEATTIFIGFCEPCTKFSPNALFSPVAWGAEAPFGDAFLRPDCYKLSIKALAGLHVIEATNTDKYEYTDAAQVSSGANSFCQEEAIERAKSV